VYGAAFAGTLIWALADAGLDFWPLVSRLMLPTGLMLLMLLVWPALRKAETGNANGKPAYMLAAVLALAMVATFVQMFQPHPTVPFQGTPTPLVPVAPGHEQKNWSSYGNTAGGAVSRRSTRSRATTSSSLKSPGPSIPATRRSALRATAPKTSKRRCKLATASICARRITM
jgi:glucose dehydrogenase